MYHLSHRMMFPLTDRFSVYKSNYSTWRYAFLPKNSIQSFSHEYILEWIMPRVNEIWATHEGMSTMGVCTWVILECRLLNGWCHNCPSLPCIQDGIAFLRRQTSIATMAVYTQDSSYYVPNQQAIVYASNKQLNEKEIMPQTKYNFLWCQNGESLVYRPKEGIDISVGEGMPWASSYGRIVPVLSLLLIPTLLRHHSIITSIFWVFSIHVSREEVTQYHARFWCPIKEASNHFSEI